MCLSLQAKGEIDTEEVLPPIQIRKRYSPARGETVLELVRPNKGCKPKTTFWLCICGSRMHADILVCNDCGKHRNHHSMPQEDAEKIEKAYRALRKELGAIEKELKGMKKDCEQKKDEDKTKPDNGCKCSEGSEKKQNEQPKVCRCEKQKKDNPCSCLKQPAPKPSPCPPQLPYIPMIPAPYLGSPPLQPEPPPDLKPSCPPQEPPIINVIVPEHRKGWRKRPHHRKRSPSISSSSSISIHSFERIKNRVSGIGRRVWGLERRESIRDEETRMRRAEDEHRRLYEIEKNARRREDLGRERVREREVEYVHDGSREGARCRNRWSQISHLGMDPDSVRFMPFPHGATDGERVCHSSTRRVWPMPERWGRE